ncbi:hypothetical protein TNCV_4065961 [Trichonephila clavipes]|uniref:Endonuclease/exonuclease/phosphatase domain-containing protein n=1 Tax=Trichonephila clavipes TaxID=2585209 RepID=A0A8X7BG28_TRICX|nr:hypothetical protein TNCV_4065961 [Trichonephila clavipes]
MRPGASIRVPNYTLYRIDRQNQNLPAGDTVEATIVVLTPPGENPLPIASVCILFSTPSACTHDLEEIFALEHSSILWGDYNAHHTHCGCNDINSRGQHIKTLIDNTDTDIIAPNTPTRDLAITPPPQLTLL